MVATVFQCPKCSQLNTTRRFTCKNCGTNFEVALAGIEPMVKTTRGSTFALIFNVFFVIVILGILAAVALPKFVTCTGYGGAKVSYARGVGSAIGGSIQAKHSDFLTNAVPYTMDDVLTSTSFAGGFTYNTTPNNTPAIGDICSNVGGNKFMCNVRGDIFGWTWTPRVGDTPALIVEDSATAFP
jgi:hypothetical protein